MFKTRVLLFLSFAITLNNVFAQNQRFPIHCQDPSITTSGVYKIDPSGQDPIQVECTVDQNNGAWTTIMNRVEFTDFFAQTYQQYVNGFSTHIYGYSFLPNNNYWLGLENIRNLVKNEPMELRIEATDGITSYFIEYDSFYIQSASNNYKLEVGKKITGNLVDSFSYHNGLGFSTSDRSVSPNPKCASA